MSFTRRPLLGALLASAAPVLWSPRSWAAPPPADSGPWPRALVVPGGVARLALGPANTAPQAFTESVLNNAQAVDLTRSFAD